MIAGPSLYKNAALLISALSLSASWAVDNSPVDKQLATTENNKNWYQLEVLIFNRVPAWLQLQQQKRLQIQATQQIAINAPELLLDTQPALYIDLAEQWYTPSLFNHPYNNVVLRNNQWQPINEPEPLLYLNQQELDDWYKAQTTSGDLTQPIAENADSLAPTSTANTDSSSPQPPATESLADKYADKSVEVAPPKYLQPTQLNQLQLSDSQLSIAYNRLNRRSAYKVLYFGSWQQQFATENTKFQIKLNGGQQYFLADELEGNLEIELKRYFHLAFDLRLNSFASSPALTANNNREPSNIYENYLSNELFSPEPLVDNEFDLTTGNPDQSLLPDAPNLTQPATEAVPPLAAPPTWQYSQWYNFFLDPNSIENTLSSCTLKPIQALPHHELEFSIAMKQSRRIARNKDVHYIDHPVLGVVVKITPLTLEQVDEQSEVLSLRD